MQDIVKEDHITRRSISYAYDLGFIRRVGSWPKNHTLKFSHLSYFNERFSFNCNENWTKINMLNKTLTDVAIPQWLFLFRAIRI